MRARTERERGRRREKRANTLIALLISTLPVYEVPLQASFKGPHIQIGTETLCWKGILFVYSSTEKSVTILVRDGIRQIAVMII